MLEQMLACHCSPAMAGIKPSNIITCDKNKMIDVKQQMAQLNSKLNSKDIYIDTLCECKNRLLLIVYRKKKLMKQLKDRDISKFLKSYGYDENGTLNDYFNVLRSHLCMDDFPHEIGAFLGYPLDDIYGFINSKGKDFLYVGAWKVYSDVEGAQKMFCRYKNCTKAICKRVENGQSLAQIFYAA